MTGQARLLSVHFGKQTSAVDFSSTPGTLYRIRPEEGSDLLPLDYVRLERNLVASDGQEFPDVIGPQDLSPRTVNMQLTGLSDSDGGAVDHLATMEMGAMLDCIFGAVPVDPANAATTASGSSGTTVTVAAGTDIANLSLIGVSNGTVVQARQVASGGGTTSIVTNVAVGGTATGAVYRGPMWALQSTVAQHVHGYLRAEWEDARRNYFGCMPSGLSLDMTEGQIVKAATSWLPNSWTDTAEADPAYADAVTGSPIVAINSAFYVGATEFVPLGLKLDLGYSLAPRKTPSGTNGVNGQVVVRKKPVLSGFLYFGTNTDEISDNASTPSLADLTSGAATTRDVMVQIGRTPGAILFIRIPCAQFKARVVDQGGITCIQFSAEAKRNSAGAMLYLGIL